jgi:hypothetical protein
MNALVSTARVTCATSRETKWSWLQKCERRQFPFQGGHANDVTIVASQIHGPATQRKAGFLSRLLVAVLQHCVTGAVGCRASALRWLFAVVGGVAAKGRW